MLPLDQIVKNVGVTSNEFFWIMVHFLQWTWTYKGTMLEKRNSPSPGATTNYLEVMIDDEKITKIQLDKICGSSHELFFHTIIHGR